MTFQVGDVSARRVLVGIERRNAGVHFVDLCVESVAFFLQLVDDGQLHFYFLFFGTELMANHGSDKPKDCSHKD